MTFSNAAGWKRGQRPIIFTKPVLARVPSPERLGKKEMCVCVCVLVGYMDNPENLKGFQCRQGVDRARSRRDYSREEIKCKKSMGRYSLKWEEHW